MVTNLRGAVLRAAFPTEIPGDEVQPGDILVYQELGAEENLHLMVYIGNEEVVGACEDGPGVIHRPATYDHRWELAGALRIRRARQTFDNQR